jgi:hypothetical protein
LQLCNLKSAMKKTK